MERLRVLQVFADVGAKFNRASQDYTNAVREELRKLRLKAYVDGASRMWHRDNASHFVLQLAFCRSHEMRQWFLGQEADLFRFRFQNETAANVDAFLRRVRIEYRPIEAQEKEALAQHLADSFPDGTDLDVVYKVPFAEALELISERSVYLERGSAYIPRAGVLAVATCRFRRHLSAMLEDAARRVPHLHEDERLEQLSSLLHKGRKSFRAGGLPEGSVTADMVDELSRQSFPLCMKTMHEALRSQHHLRHGGRMQYGLFLKGIGLSLDEALRFWREEFAQRVGIDTFEKKYSYNIRHNYGREGRRVNYTPYSCTAIVTGAAPGPLDAHGCPFAHWGRNELQAKLRAEGVSGEQLHEVMQQVEKGHYQLACTTVLRATHEALGQDSEVVRHPNEYYEWSRAARASAGREEPCFEDDLDEACLRALEAADGCP